MSGAIPREIPPSRNKQFFKFGVSRDSKSKEDFHISKSPLRLAAFGRIWSHLISFQTEINSKQKVSKRCQQTFGRTCWLLYKRIPFVQTIKNQVRILSRTFRDFLAPFFYLFASILCFFLLASLPFFVFCFLFSVFIYYLFSCYAFCVGPTKLVLLKNWNTSYSTVR